MLTIRTLSSIGVLKISGTTEVNLVQVFGATEIRAVLFPTPQTAPDVAHLVSAFVDGSPYAIAFVQWTQVEIDALTSKTVVLTGATLPSGVTDIVVEVDPQ